MKKTLIILLVLAAVATAAGAVFCVASTFCDKALKGSGHVVTRTVTLTAFDEVEASRAVNVILIEGTSQQAEIKADDNIIDYVVVRVEEGELKIGIDPSIQSISNVNVTVTVPTDGKIKQLEANSAARIASHVVLQSNDLELNTSSAAAIDVKANVTKCDAEATSASEIKADIEASECKIETSSAAKIFLSGSADRCELEASSAATFNADDFVVNRYDIEVSSAANAVLHCMQVLTGSVSSGASVSYFGDCQNKAGASSGGSISHSGQRQSKARTLAKVVVPQYDDTKNNTDTVSGATVQEK